MIDDPHGALALLGSAFSHGQWKAREPHLLRLRPTSWLAESSSGVAGVQTRLMLTIWTNCNRKSPK